MNKSDTYVTRVCALVNTYYEEKGYGFVRIYDDINSGCWETVFVHCSDVTNADSLEKNQELRCDAYLESNGWRATNVEVID